MASVPLWPWSDLDIVRLDWGGNTGDYLTCLTLLLL